MVEKIREEAKDNYPEGDVWTNEEVLVRRLAFINGATWMKEEMEKLKDFDTWKEWKNTGIIKSE